MTREIEILLNSLEETLMKLREELMTMDKSQMISEGREILLSLIKTNNSYNILKI